MESLLEELSKRLIIDKHDLDNELVHYPSLLHDIGQRYTLSVADREEARIYLEQIKAETEQGIRDELSEKKLTDRNISSRVEMHRDVMEAQRDWLRARQIADSWKVLYDACEKRSYVLAQLVELWVRGYYTSPGISVRRDAVDRTAEIARESMSVERVKRASGGNG